MEFTGERMIPEYNNEDIIYSEHLLRYNFAKQFVKNKAVLDVASGSGYGTKILADSNAKHVTGVDISSAAIQYASDNYKSTNIKFIEADGTKLPFEDNCFDVIVSFETIEHLKDHDAFVTQIARVLKTDGTLVISSPNKDIYPEGNEFHFREFTKKEFTSILKKHFKYIKLYQQNNFMVSSLYENGNSISKSSNDVVDELKSDGMYFVAVCSNDKLPKVQTQNLIASPSEISSQSVVHERETHIEILQSEIEELKNNIKYLQEHSSNDERLSQLNDHLKILELTYSKELEKNAILENTIVKDESRFNELVKLLRENEIKIEKIYLEKAKFEKEISSLHNFETLYIEEKEKAEYLYKELNEINPQFEEMKLSLSVVQSENLDIHEQIKQLKDIEDKYIEECEKAEYLYSLSKQKEKELSMVYAEKEALLESQITLQDIKEDLLFQINKIDEEKSDLIENLNDENKALKFKVQTLSNDKESYRDEIDILTKEIKALSSKINDEQKKGIYLYDEVQKLLGIREEHQKSIKNIEKLLIEEKNINERLFKQLEELLDEKRIADKKLNDNENKISTITELLHKTEIERNNYLNEVASLKESIDFQTNTANAFCIEIETLKKNISKNSSTSSIQEAKIQSVEKENIKLNTELEISKSLLKEKDILIYKIDQQLINLKNIIDSQEKNINIVNEKNRLLLNEAEQLKGLLSDQKNSNLLLESKIDFLSKEIEAFKQSISWKITYPFRLFVKILLWLFKPLFSLLRDFKYAIQLLHREGLGSFFYRIYWYIRGKRLIEEIQHSKNTQFYVNKSKKGEKKDIAFQKYKNPKVSIIIPVFNQWNYTYDCLNSIFENTEGVEYEIILADDGSIDETIDVKQIVKNITVIRNKENLRFLLNCNSAAKKAKGEFILFLNNDTYVHDNWLNALLATFDKHENVGIVGAKLVYEDGRLQEAGGIIWDDASGWNFGRLSDPELPDFNYVKEVDYISGACLMIPKKLWNEIGGFDSHFVPAYYEDTDICFEVRKRGYKVLYQPKSVVTHFEGISNGTDESTGQKQYQVTNHKKFFDKWKIILQKEHFPNAENVFLARERSRNKKQILVIDHYVPHFDKDAGSRSTYSYLKLFIKMGFNVKFIGDNFFKHEPYTTELEQMGIEVLYGNYYFNNVHKWIRENGKYFDYVFAHRMHIAPKYFINLKKYSDAKIIYIGHDLQFIKSKKEFEFSKKDEHLKNYEKFKEIETAIFKTVDIIYPFSTYEAPLIQEIVPDKTVRAIPVYFFEDEYRQRNKFNARKDILFVGGFGHPPNVDAVTWFAKDIFPLVLKEIPDLIFHIVGSNPTKEIIALKSDNIKVTGFISDEELKEYYERCKISVLPLRVGAGVKGKLLEAMYYKLPTVITSIAAEGVPNIEKSCSIADSENEFAAKIIHLYMNKHEWNDFSIRGAELIKEFYSEKSASDLLKKDLI